MVNAVNSPRAVPELGARRDEVLARPEPAVQDVRQEAARLLERHKRRLGEGGNAVVQPQRLPDSVPTSLRMKVPVASTGDAMSGLAANAHATTKPDEADMAQRPATTVLAKIALREAEGMQTDAMTDGRADPAAKVSLETEVTISAADSEAHQRQPGTNRSVQEDEYKSVPLPQQAGGKFAGAEARSLTQSALKTLQPAPRKVDTAVPAQVSSTAAEARNASTVFDVPLRGLGAQHSTQVSLHLASGQVVLTPSSERAADVLMTAAQATDWVSVEDATDERRAPRRENDADDEGGT